MCISFSFITLVIHVEKITVSIRAAGGVTSTSIRLMKLTISRQQLVFTRGRYAVGLSHEEHSQAGSVAVHQHVCATFQTRLSVALHPIPASFSCRSLWKYDSWSKGQKSGLTYLYCSNSCQHVLHSRNDCQPHQCLLIIYVLPIHAGISMPREKIVANVLLHACPSMDGIHITQL